MPLLGNYSTGTVTVAANGVAVTGAGTQWLAAGIREGDEFVARGLTATILSVNSATSITLEKPWPGTALSAAAYEVRYTADASRVLAASREAISLFGANAAAIADAQLRKNNLTATRAPVATDDSAAGYGIGSRWMRGQDEWVATSVAPGAAAWKLVGSGTAGGSSGPTLYASSSAFYAATVPAEASLVFVTNGGETIAYRRQPGASGPQDLHHPNGSDWAKGTLSQADLLGAITDVTTSIDRIPYQSGAFGGLTIVPQTPGTFACSYTVQRISWQRIGNIVHFELRIAGTPSLGTATGQLRIHGFPFAAAAAGAGGATIRAANGINLLHYVSGTPSSPAYASGYFPDGVTYMILNIGAPAGEGFNFVPIDRLTSGTPFRIEAFGQYEIQI